MQPEVPPQSHMGLGGNLRAGNQEVDGIVLNVYILKESLKNQLKLNQAWLNFSYYRLRIKLIEKLCSDWISESCSLAGI